jgi:hypothetical protein
MRGSKEDLPKTVDGAEVTIREAEWGEMHVGLESYHKTVDIDVCQCHHWGMVLKGRMLVKYRDHEEVVKAGEAYYMAPEHSPIIDAGTELVEFTPKEEAKKSQ